MIRHYLTRLRAADATWRARRANLDDSPDLLLPSFKVALGILTVGTAVALLGISFYLGLI